MDTLKIDEVLQDIKVVFIDILKKIDLGASNFVKNTTFELQGDEIIVSMPNYADFIDGGRKKNSKAPPIKAIKKFIRDKNISIPNGSTEESLAFAIARSIGKKGIKAKPFLNQLQIEVQEIVQNYIFAEVNDILIKTFNVV